METENKLSLSFDSLNLSDNVLRGIYSYGFENPSQIQQKAIPIILNGKDLIAQAQSGTGKTGAFLIGILEKVDTSLNGTQILILAPTHELVHQIYNVLNELSKFLNIKSTILIGGTNIIDSREELKKIPHIIIGSPGRVLDMIQKKCFFTEHLKTVVFDEADETLSYGFKETIYNIIKTIPNETQICLFSATLPNDIIELSDKFMKNSEKILVNNEALTLDGITQFYIDVKYDDWKYETLKDLYDTINISQSIIYINTKFKLMQIYKNLLKDNFPVACIHGELSSSERKEIMNNFRNGHIRILLSTDLLSRGIDVQQLSLVINYDIPKHKETYIHRIGRSGRYGRKGVAINFITNREIESISELSLFYNTTIKEMPQNLEDYLNNI